MENLRKPPKDLPFYAKFITCCMLKDCVVQTAEFLVFRRLHRCNFRNIWKCTGKVFENVGKKDFVPCVLCHSQAQHNPSDI
jgi:hypothetical protein